MKSVASVGGSKPRFVRMTALAISALVLTVGGKLRVLHPGTRKLIKLETRPAETCEIRP